MTDLPECSVRIETGAIDGGYAAATLSVCGKYRFELTRSWRAGPMGLVLLHNPSTADHLRNDPTIRRLIQWHHRWGFGGFRVVNLLPIRTSSPREAFEWYLQACIGDDQVFLRRNFDLVEKSAAGAGQVLLGYGNVNADLRQLADLYIEEFLHAGLMPKVLARTKHGMPVHPMARGRHRVPDDVVPRVA